MSGLWSIDNYGQVLIEEDEEDYTKFYVSFPLPTGQIFTFPATRSVNTLAMDPNYTIPADGFEFFICYADGSSLSPGSPAEFEFADDNTFASSGFFIGIESGGSYYLGNLWCRYRYKNRVTIDNLRIFSFGAGQDNVPGSLFISEL